MATDDDFVVYTSPNGRFYTKHASQDARGGESLFRGSHKECMDFVHNKPEKKITPKTNKRKERAQTKQKVTKMIRGLHQDELNEVEAFILKLKAKRS